MRYLLILSLLCLSLVLPHSAAAQNYVPKAGETIMKVVVEGRGNIYVLLITDKAPLASAHIARLSRDGFYNGQRFHKVVRSPRPFIAQVGDPASRTGDLNELGRGGSGVRVPYEETGLSHEEGTVALASPPKDPNGGDSQFFFVLESAHFLDGKYTIFGKVVEGLDLMRTFQKGDRVKSITILSK